MQSVSITVEVVIITKNMHFDNSRPIRHQLELPAVISCLRHLRGDTRVETPRVKRTTEEELRDTALHRVAIVGVHDLIRGSRLLSPV